MTKFWVRIRVGIMVRLEPGDSIVLGPGLRVSAVVRSNSNELWMLHV